MGMYESFTHSETGTTISDGDFVLLECGQREYVAGYVSAIEHAMLFLDQAYKAYSNGSVYTYPSRAENYGDGHIVLLNDIEYTCKVIESEVAEKLLKEKDIFFVLKEELSIIDSKVLSQIMDRIKEIM